jgi:hypothetical protein
LVPQTLTGIASLFWSHLSAPFCPSRPEALNGFGRFHDFDGDSAGREIFSLRFNSISSRLAERMTLDGPSLEMA